MRVRQIGRFGLGLRIWIDGSNGVLMECLVGCFELFHWNACGVGM